MVRQVFYYVAIYKIGLQGRIPIFDADQFASRMSFGVQLTVG